LRALLLLFLWVLFVRAVCWRASFGVLLKQRLLLCLAALLRAAGDGRRACCKFGRATVRWRVVVWCTFKQLAFLGLAALQARRMMVGKCAAGYAALDLRAVEPSVHC